MTSQRDLAERRTPTESRACPLLQRIVLGVGAAGLGAFGVLVLAVAPSGAVAAPSCSTVSAATVRATLGGAPATPGTSSPQTNSFDGYTQTEITCDYSTTSALENISYSTPATLADYKLALATLKHATVVKSVSGIGTAAFSGTGTNTISTYNSATKKSTNTTVTLQNLWVLVSGKTFFEISASKVSVAQEEALAKKMIPLV